MAWLRALLAGMAVLDVRNFLNSTRDRAGSPEFYDPVLIARVMHLPPVSDAVADLLSLGVHVGALALVIGGFRRVPAAVQHVAGAIFTVSYVLWVIWGMSYGYVAHDHMAITVGVVLLATAGTARYGGGLDADVAAGWPVRTIQILTVATYTGSAIAKFVLSDFSLIRWANSGTLAWAFIRRPNELNALLVSHPWVLRAAQWSTLVLELGAPVVFFLRRYWLALAIAAFCGFHLITYLLLEIHFLPTVICWSAFVSWERLPAWCTGIARRGRDKLRTSDRVLGGDEPAEPGVRVETS